MMDISEEITVNRPHFVQQNVSLSPFNTFQFSYQAQYLAMVDTIDSLKVAVNWAHQQHLPITVIGGGSNLLIRNNIIGLVIVNRLVGKKCVVEEGGVVLLQVAAGENWHEFVRYAVHKGLFGVENLALIPGTVGAAPVQNIGAYGVEAKDVIERVQVLDLLHDKLQWILAKDCGFGYRDSHFKGKWKGRYLITAVEFKLTRISTFVLNYGGLANQIKGEVTLSAVFEAVCDVRRHKLPDPSVIANAGSFFKNPIICAEQHRRLKQIFPALVSFPVDDDYKLAAGWLIDQAGWKGVRHQGVGVYDKQALVLVNYSEQNAVALLALESLIKQSVFERYGVYLEREPVELPTVLSAKEELS